MTTIINGSSPSITFSDGSAQTSATRPFQNRIINGAMVVSQRGTSFSTGGYTLDRFYSDTTTAGAWTITQSSTAPAGFVKSLLYTKTTGNAPSSGDYNYLVQFVEGLNCTDLAWGTANAKTVTLSFWVYSGATGTFGGSLRNGAGDYSYPFTYTISSANTWTQATVTIAGPTTGTWLTTNGIGISVFFDLGSGTSARATAGSWIAGNYIGASGTSTYPTSTSSGVLYFTGVQLEVGSTATSFDYRPYGTELALCQRYYYKSSGVASMAFGVGFNSSTTGCDNLICFPVTMRVAPSALEQSGTAADYQVAHAATATACSSVPTYANASLNAARITGIVASGLTTGQGSLFRAANTSAFLAWSAEL
jgi:hypothetical protein